MDKIYCISYGFYDDFRIKYSFKSKEKRDKLFEKLKEDIEYQLHDIELDDDKIDIDSVKQHYSISMIQYDELKIDSYRSDSSHEFCIKEKIVHINDNGDINHMFLPITKEQYDKGVKYYRHKYTQIYNKTQNSIKKLMEEGISIEEIRIIINMEID